MKIPLIILIFLTFFNSQSANISITDPSIKSFLEETALPSYYKNALEQYKDSDEIERMEDFPLYPKKDLSRIINALRLKRCIKTHNLDHLEVANKYLGSIKDSWIVFSEEVKGDFINRRRFSKSMAQQLIILAQETGFCDWGLRSNWLWKEGANTLVCIDTEDRSFSPNSILNALSKLQSQWGRSFPKDELQELDSKIQEQQNHSTAPVFAKYDNPAYNTNLIIGYLTRPR